MEHFRAWLHTHLLDRDVVIVGFWSDWAYLSDILASTIDAVGPRSVYLVDPSSPQDLQAKAPGMWAWANRPGIGFHHERESGAEFLDSLRRRFSQVFLTRTLEEAADTYRTMFGEEPPGDDNELNGADSRALYALRRDLTGVARTAVVRDRNPLPRHRVQAAIHSRLLAMGAAYQGHVYTFRGDTLRLIGAGGELMSEVRRRHESEPPLLTPVSRVVCVGAVEDPTPGNVVRPDESPTIIRGGVPGTWVTHTQLLPELVGNV